jgi:hypothetical protein
MTRTIDIEAINGPQMVDLTVKVISLKFFGRMLASLYAIWLMSAPQRGLELIQVGLFGSQKNGSGASPELNTACRCPLLQQK